MNRFLPPLVAIAVLAVATSNARPGDDLKDLEGKWKAVYFERDGKEVKLQNETFSTITGDKYVIKSGDNVVAAGTMKLDPSKNPKAVDITYTDGPDKGKTFKGIYQIDGDTSKFCRAGAPDQERPTEFKTKEGSGGFIVMYKRLKQ